MTPTPFPSPPTDAASRPLRVGSCADITDLRWRWIADSVDPSLADWTFFLTLPRNVWERLIKRPALARYRACHALARGGISGHLDLLVTHLPLVTCWTETFCRRRRECPHVAFAFNFTTLPTGPRLALMRRAFRTVDRFIVFSGFERIRYADYLGIPIDRIDVIPWRIQDPRQRRAHSVESPHADPAPEPLQRDAICAVGSQGRDYATLLEAMRRLPHIPLILVADFKNLQGLTPPANVEVRRNIPLSEAEAILRQSRFVVVPLRDAQTACGHVTIVFSQFEERAIVATESAALAEYVIPGRNGVFVPPHDAAALANAIERLWNDPNEARRLGVAGRELALSQSLESQTVDYVKQMLERLRSTGKV